MSSSNFSIGWSMIANHDGTSGYAQSGFHRYSGSGAFHYAEDNRTGCGSATCYRRKITTAVTYGEEHQYWVQWDTTAHFLDENVDVTRYQISNLDPFGNCTVPFANEWYGEIRHADSDIPGASASQTRLSQMQIQRLDNDAWQVVSNGHPALSGLNDNPGKFARSGVSYGSSIGTQFSIYTINPF